MEAALARIEEKKRKLADQYMQVLDVRILELENAAVLLRENPGHVEAMTRIGAICHKLAGISESVGQPEIGRLAAEVSDLVCAKAACWGEIESVLENLLEMMEDKLK